MQSTIDVRFYELDAYGHVNHAVYLNYFEVARIELLEQIGFGLRHLRELGFHLLVVDIRVRYHAPAQEGDRLTVTSTLTRLGRASATWTQQLTRNDEVIATAEVRSAITDRDGRPARPPDAFGRALQALYEQDVPPNATSNSTGQMSLGR